MRIFDLIGTFLHSAVPLIPPNYSMRTSSENRFRFPRGNGFTQAEAELAMKDPATLKAQTSQ